MDTSGLLVVGLTPAAQATISYQFECRTVAKRYVALVEGRPARPEGLVDLPLRPDINNRPYQIVDFVHGRDARTHYRVLETFASAAGDISRIEYQPLTGRAHQLRVHSATPHNAFPNQPPHQQGGLSCPILGDILYGDPHASGRLMLHASELTFTDPDTNSRVSFNAPAPF
jgi:tRNA pseudouridine32 synthase/23S rRNA pseudouridine746 synthase